MPPRKQKKAAPAKGRGPGRERIIEALWEAHGFVGDFKQEIKRADGSVVEKAYTGAATILGITSGALTLRLKKDKGLYIEQVKAALAKTGGHISQAAQVIGCARETLSRFIGTYKLKEYQLDCEQAYCDTAKLTLKDAMTQRDKGFVTPAGVTAAIYTLKTKGKDDGWSERVEFTGPGGGPIEFIEGARERLMEKLARHEKADQRDRPKPH